MQIENIRHKRNRNIVKFFIEKDNVEIMQFDIDVSYVNMKEFDEFSDKVDRMKKSKLRLGNGFFIRYKRDGTVVFEQPNFVISVKCDFGPEILRECIDCFMYDDLYSSKEDSSSEEEEVTLRKEKVIRAPSPYILFCNEKRPILKIQKSYLTFGETGKELAQMWADLSQEEKDRYVQMSAERKKMLGK